MSVKLMAEVWTLVLTSGQRDVLLVLADHADDDGICWPSVRRIAWKTDKDPRSVRRILRGLEEQKVIQCVGNEKGGYDRPRIYKIFLKRADKKSPYPGDDPETQIKGGLTSGITGDEFPTSTGEDETPALSEGEDISGQRGDATARSTDTDARRGDIAMSAEPPLNHQEPPNTPVGNDERSRSSVTELPSRNAGQILGEVLEAGTRYPRRFKGHLGREVNHLLREGFDSELVAEAARRCVAKGLQPSTMASLIVEVRSDRDKGPYRNPDATDYENTRVG